MAPSSSVKETSRRAARPLTNYARAKPQEDTNARVVHDVIDGLDIFSFQNELELEYFSNIEEPLPRKIKRFRGFEDRCPDLDLLKNSFEAFVKNFGQTETSAKKDGPEESVESLEISDDENSFNTDEPMVVATATTDDVPVVVVGQPAPDVDRPAPVAENPIEIITIDDDSDDDVIMISDPKAPLPKPVQNCCPNCGKFRRAKPLANEKNKRTRNSAHSNGVLIINDEQPVRLLTPYKTLPEKPAKTPGQGEAHIVLTKTPQEESKSEAITDAPQKPTSASCIETTKDSSMQSELTDDVYKPKHPIKKPPVVPGSVKVVLPDTGRAIILKLDGTKSKFLPPSTKKTSIRVMLPKRKVSAPVDDGTNKAHQARQDVPRNVPVPNCGGAKPSDVGINSLRELPAKQQPTVLRQLAMGNVEPHQSMKIIPVVSDDFPSAVPCEMDSSATILPTSDVGFENLICIDNIYSKPLVVGDDTKAVVEGLVDYVCRKELFPHSYPYDEPRATDFPCLTAPCRESRCRLGCICVSLAKKTIRRARCKNASCIFGCSCISHASRYSRFPRILGTHRRKQLTVLPHCDPEPSSLTQKTVGAPVSSNGSVHLPAMVAVQKLTSHRLGPDPLPAMTSTQKRTSNGLGPDRLPAMPSAQKLTSHGLGPDRLPAMTAPQKLTPGTRSTPEVPTSRNPRDVEVASPPAVTASLPQRRFFGREKVPIPERALVCLTPGLGYVPLVEITPRVTLINPFQQGSTTKSFHRVKEATQWLNFELQTLFVSGSDLRWVVADKSTIEKKQLHRLSVETLKSPKSTSAKSGPFLSN